MSRTANYRFVVQIQSSTKSFKTNAGAGGYTTEATVRASIETAYRGSEVLAGTDGGKRSPILASYGYYWIKFRYRRNFTPTPKHRCVYNNRYFDVMTVTIEQVGAHRDYVLLCREVK